MRGVVLSCKRSSPLSPVNLLPTAPLRPPVSELGTGNCTARDYATCSDARIGRSSTASCRTLQYSSLLPESPMGAVHPTCPSSGKPHRTGRSRSAPPSYVIRRPGSSRLPLHETSTLRRALCTRGLQCRFQCSPLPLPHPRAVTASRLALVAGQNAAGRCREILGQKLGSQCPEIPRVC